MGSNPTAAVQRMRSDLFYADHYRERARALDHLGSLLRCETPGTVEQVAVRGKHWWRRQRDHADRAPKEIILTDDELREFRDWCEERAAALSVKADQIEARIANPTSLNSQEADRG